MGMKKIALLFTGLIVLYGAINAQETVIVGWTFPGNSAVADTGIDVNLDMEIYTVGGTSEIDFKNGFETKAAQVTEWKDGMGTKAWVVSFSSEGYSGLTVSSMQSSGGNDPGPKDFKIQYSIDNGTSWIDVANGVVAVENDWTTGVADSLELPEDCNDNPEIQIRWLMASNEASGGASSVLESGKSKIDEICIRGDKISGIENLKLKLGLEIGPNPATTNINISSDSEMKKILICDVSGRVVLQKNSNTHHELIDIVALPKGLYILSVSYWENDIILKRKIMVN